MTPVHAFNPGGGLHHAMAARASGFCIYNDVALGVAAARDAGHRVLYVDLDVHHGDGTQALFADDPEVLTFSIHESGRSLFPGTGDVDEVGGPGAPGHGREHPARPVFRGRELAGRSGVGVARAGGRVPADVPGQPARLRQPRVRPAGPSPLTTAAYVRATTLLDAIAHEWCEGRWLATGGGGYDAYRVVPRSWALVWLAQAHQEVPAETPSAWRDRWSEEAARYRQAPLPVAFLDPADLAAAEPDGMGERNARTAARSMAQALELLARR